MKHGLSKILRWHMRLWREAGRQSVLLVGGDSHRLCLDVLLRGLSDFDLATSVGVVAPSAVHAAVPPVLDGIVAAATQSSRDLRPSLAHFSDHLFDEHSFLGSDRVMVQVWFEILMEALAALLGRTGLDSL